LFSFLLLFHKPLRQNSTASIFFVNINHTISRWLDTLFCYKFTSLFLGTKRKGNELCPQSYIVVPSFEEEMVTFRCFSPVQHISLYRALLFIVLFVVKAKPCWLGSPSANLPLMFMYDDWLIRETVAVGAEWPVAQCLLSSRTHGWTQAPVVYRPVVLNHFSSRTPRLCNFSSTSYPYSCWCIIQIIYSL
jgi:hypothetical protein